MENRNIIVNSEEEQKIKKQLEDRHDPESERLKRFIAMPDLARTSGSPNTN